MVESKERGIIPLRSIDPVEPVTLVDERTFPKRANFPWKATAVILSLTLLAGALLLGGARLVGRSLVFFPEREIEQTPADWDLPFEDVSFLTLDGVQLHGWFVPGDREVTLLWFHGNSGNISHRLENLKLLHDRLGVNIFIFDYRGYGRSDGRISEQGTYLDGEGAVLYLRSRGDIRADRVVLFGRSLGSAVAVDVATRYPAYGLILESPFTSVSDIAKRSFRFLPWGRIIGIRYDSLSKIRGISGPLLVLHGDRDDVVPMENGQRLFRAAPSPKEFYVVEGAGHNDTYTVGGEEYFATLRRFVDGLGTQAPE